MRLNNKHIIKFCQVSARSAYRLASTLKLARILQNNHLFYEVPETHPLAQSILLLQSAPDTTKAIYTVKELTFLWQWHKGQYSTERVRQLLQQYQIPVYNQHNKGLIFLSDLQQLLRTSI